MITRSKFGGGSLSGKGVQVLSNLLTDSSLFSKWNSDVAKFKKITRRICLFC